MYFYVRSEETEKGLFRKLKISCCSRRTHRRQRCRTWLGWPRHFQFRVCSYTNSELGNKSSSTMSSFNGFSEEDIQKMKTQQTLPNIDKDLASPLKKGTQIGTKQIRVQQKYKLHVNKDDHLDNIDFQKSKLSLKAPTDDCNNVINNVDGHSKTTECCTDGNNAHIQNYSHKKSIDSTINENILNEQVDLNSGFNNEESEKIQTVKLEELQLKQKVMEEQNRKRKEMLAKALADRTKQTEQEVQKLDKIKQELSVLDGQLSQDVAVLRTKIDHACLSYAEAEKQYLRVEKEFLQAKINLQKEREKKELLSEHLCALITHNETRKAQKLVQLMEQLASGNPLADETEVKTSLKTDPKIIDALDDSAGAIIVDGVDERTGKMVEVDFT